MAPLIIVLLYCTLRGFFVPSIDSSGADLKETQASPKQALPPLAAIRRKPCERICPLEFYAQGGLTSREPPSAEVETIPKRNMEVQQTHSTTMVFHSVTSKSFQVVPFFKWRSSSLFLFRQLGASKQKRSTARSSSESFVCFT